MKIDFNGVEAPKAVERVQKVIEPGVQELEIVKVEDGTAGTGTAFVAVTLNKPENPVEYPLIERFYVSPKAKWRLMAFLEGVLNRSFSGVEIDTEQLRTELVGKRNTYVVNGEEFLKANPNGGEPYKNVRALLAYNVFINPPAGTTHFVKPLEETPKTDLPQAGSALANDTDDLPF